MFSSLNVKVRLTETVDQIGPTSLLDDKVDDLSETSQYVLALK